MGFFDGLKRDKKARTAINHEESEKEKEQEQEETPVSEDGPVEEVEDINGESDNQESVSAVDADTDEDKDEDPYLDEVPQFVGTPIKTFAEKKPVGHAIGITHIIAVLNQKGGVGKTTTAINLPAALGSLGKQVLLVDLDPQGNATSGLGIDKRVVTNDVYDLLLSDVDVKDVIIPDVSTGLDLIPATINLAGAEVELVNEMARENRLKEAIGSLRGKYDYIFIDCPPSLGLLTVNALVAADKLLIPIQCEFYALEGVTKLLDSMKRVKGRLNPSLDIFGVLLTMYDGRTTLARQVADEVRNYFGTTVFQTMIPRTVKLSEAPSYGQPIHEYDPKGKGAQSYIALAEEVIARG